MRDRHGRGPLHEASGSGEPRAVLALLVAFGGRCSCAHAAVASGAHGGGRSGCIGDSLALMASDDAGCGALKTDAYALHMHCTYTACTLHCVYSTLHILVLAL